VRAVTSSSCEDRIWVERDLDPIGEHHGAEAMSLGKEVHAEGPIDRGQLLAEQRDRTEQRSHRVTPTLLPGAPHVLERRIGRGLRFEHLAAELQPPALRTPVTPRREPPIHAIADEFLASGLDLVVDNNGCQANGSHRTLHGLSDNVLWYKCDETIELVQVGVDLSIGASRV